MFTLSSINAFLNVVVIAVFMQNEVIVLYGADGSAYKYGSRWFYLLFVCVPWLISGALFIKEVLNRKKSVQTEQSTESDDEPTDVIDEILQGKTQHSDNVGMLFTWSFAIISWVMTGIALNEIQNISVILPTIIVVMFSAIAIFVTSVYNNVSADTVCGIKLKWLSGNKEAAVRSNRLSMYLGMMSGMLGVCLAAWSLVVSNNIPNCIAVAELVVFSLILPIVYSYFQCRKTESTTKNKK